MTEAELRQRIAHLEAAIALTLELFTESTRWAVDTVHVSRKGDGYQVNIEAQMMANWPEEHDDDGNNDG